MLFPPDFLFSEDSTMLTIKILVRLCDSRYAFEYVLKW